MNINYILIPNFYFLKTRLKDNKLRFSWFLTYLIPICIFLGVMADKLSLYNVLSFILSLSLINYAYEDGYIYNDIITTQHEANPTLRLPIQDILYIRERIKNIYLLRFSISLSMLLFIFLFSELKYTILSFIVYFTINFIYYVYNNTRTILNLFLIIPLSFFRFFGVVIIYFYSNDFLLQIFVLILLYPLSKFIEFSTRDRFNISLAKKYIKDFNYFRVVYYFIVSLVVYFIYADDKYYFVYLIVALYYFLYRVLCLILISYNKSIRSAVTKSHRKHKK